MPISPDDLRYLRRTLALARRGCGRTSPNPMVGAVVVRDGQVAGEGFHPKAGEPHAEVFALRAAGDRASGATLYVSLEPCVHYGRTPPCTDLIIRSGVRRVVFASLDPNPKVAGRSLEILRGAGIAVDYGACTEAEQRLNEAYRYWVQHRRPFVTVKLAASLDGKLATVAGESQWITGEAARRDVHRLRAQQDAILTTAPTVLADNPALTARIPGGRDPRRVVVDTTLRTPPDARVYDPAPRAPILATAVRDEDRLAPFHLRGVETLLLPAHEGHLDLPALMAALGERDITSILVEAGGIFAAALVEAGLIHKLRLYLAPLLIGGAGAPASFAGRGVAHLADAPRLHGMTCTRIGEDYRIEGYLGRTMK